MGGRTYKYPFRLPIVHWVIGIEDVLDITIVVVIVGRIPSCAGQYHHEVRRCLGHNRSQQRNAHLATIPVSVSYLYINIGRRFSSYNKNGPSSTQIASWPVEYIGSTAAEVGRTIEINSPHKTKAKTPVAFRLIFSISVTSSACTYCKCEFRTKTTIWSAILTFTWPPSIFFICF